jgi:hypothetical protein
MPSGVVRAYIGAMNKIARLLSRNYEYLIAILFLAILMALVIYSFMVTDLFRDKDKAFTVTLSSIGILLALFQFAFTQITNQKKKYFDLRYTFYKDTVKQLQLISDVIQEGLLLEVDPRDTRHKLMSAVNDFSLLARANEEYLFPMLSQKEHTKELNKLIEGMMKRTSTYTIAVMNSNSEDVATIENMNWHNSILELLRRFNSVKHEYLSVVRQYL